MSYILDALKKADAERERGTVPGLHSHPQGQVDGDDDEAPARPVAPAVWLGAGVGICLIAVLSWQLLSRPAAPTAELHAERGSEPTAPLEAAPQTERAVPPQAATTPQAESAYNPPGVAPTPPPHVKPAAQDKAPTALRARPAPPPSAITQQPTITPSPAAANTAANEAPHPAPLPALKAPAQAPTGTPATRGTAARIPLMSELPDDIKRDLPQLMIGGAMYSDTPSSRMLIINSQVFHEGDQPYQGLVLEEIRLKSAVFKYRGYRYAINY